MTKSRIYPVGLVVALCWLCASMLTFAHTQWSDRIAANERLARTRAVVEALGLWTPDQGPEAAVETFNRSVTLVKKQDMVVHEGRREGTLIGYAVDVQGRGAYGPIHGIMAVDPACQRIIALNVYQQMETPGLGGQIASPEWLRQFAGKALVTGGVPGIAVSSTDTGPNVIQAITGASRTSHAVGVFVNKAISELLAGGMRLEELNLDIGTDAVTRATPGYPKNQPKPPHLRPEVRRPAFMVPPGARNLALGRPVISSMEDEPVIGELKQITDGVKKSGQFDYVELDAGPQWVQIDLGRTCNIHAVVVWHFYQNPIVYNDVIVQIADDAEFKRNARTLFNNDHDNSSGLGTGKDTAYFSRWWGEIVDARGPDYKGELARFVRVHTNSGSGGEDTRFVEIGVYGH